MEFQGNDTKRHQELPSRGKYIVRYGIMVIRSYLLSFIQIDVPHYSVMRNASIYPRIARKNRT